MADPSRLVSVLTVNTKELRREGEIHLAAGRAELSGSDTFHLSQLGTNLHRIADAIDGATRSNASLTEAALLAIDNARQARDRDDAKGDGAAPASPAAPTATPPAAARKGAKASASAPGGKKASKTPTHEDVGTAADRPDVKS